MGLLAVLVIAAGVRLVRSGAGHGHAHFAKQPQEAGERVSVTAHGCSLRVPRGWIAREIPNGGVMFIAPQESGYLANLIILSEPFGGALSEFANTNIAGAKEAMPASKFAADAAFATESGAPVFKATISNKRGDLELAQAMYFFDGPEGRKIGVTTTSHARDEAAMQLLFDTCLKSLAVLDP
jgi:hypothetical protein